MLEEVTDASLIKAFKACSQLRTIFIHNCPRVTNSIIRPIASYCINLRSLDFRGAHDFLHLGMNNLFKHIPGHVVYVSSNHVIFRRSRVIL